jgi:hypothetical protein
MDVSEIVSYTLFSMWLLGHEEQGFARWFENLQVGWYRRIIFELFKVLCIITTKDSDEKHQSCWASKAELRSTYISLNKLQEILTQVNKHRTQCRIGGSGGWLAFLVSQISSYQEWLHLQRSEDNFSKDQLPPLTPSDGKSWEKGISVRIKLI